MTADTIYSVQITFAQDNGVETVAGTSSANVTPTGANLSINLTSIPVSLEALVTSRKVYLKKASGAYFLHTTIANNTATTLSITSDTSSTIEPPDHESIRKISGAPFFESGPQNYLQAKELDQIRRLAQGAFSTNNPEYFSLMDINSVVLYPLPQAGLELSFNYYRLPSRLYNSESSRPDLPIYLKQVLKAGVIAMGFEYRDRAGQEIKKQNYEAQLTDAFSRFGRVAEIEYTVRDVYGDSDGFEVN